MSQPYREHDKLRTPQTLPLIPWIYIYTNYVVSFNFEIHDSMTIDIPTLSTPSFVFTDFWDGGIMVKFGDVLRLIVPQVVSSIGWNQQSN